MNIILRKTDALMHSKFIKAMNIKVEIVDRWNHTHDVYLKLGWAIRRWVWIDITISRFSEDRNNEHSDVANDVDRIIEIVCHHATELLQSGHRDISDIMKRWKGTHFSPYGTCESIRNEFNEGIVTSPLDAVAKSIEKNVDRWTETNRRNERMDDEYIEGLVSDCLRQIDETPDSFTEWEIAFIKEIEDKIFSSHLSEKEKDKLEEIHENRVVA